MTELYIDNQPADWDPTTDLSISAAVPSSLDGVEEVVCSKTITIPATLRNRQLMGDCSHPHSKAMFNQEEHTARVEVDGSILFEGRLHLTASAIGDDGYYCFEIVSERAEWLKTLKQTTIASLMSSWSREITSTSLRKGWTTAGEMVRFLPVCRGAGSDAEGHRARLLPENYHPFIHLGSLLRAMFAEAGYAVSSSFMGSNFFNSLHMSGRWREINSEGWKSAMDFKAVRSEDSPTVKAHYFGRVFASPIKYYNTIGNLVEVPDGSVEGAFNAGCFGLEESSGRICFTPTRPVQVAFDYHLRWRTEYRIKSRTELIGLSSVKFSLTDSESVPLVNNFHDFRNETLGVNYLYNLMLFERVEGATYFLVADEQLSDGSVQPIRLLSTTESYTPFQITTTNPLRNLRLELELDGEMFSALVDWAIYDGCVTERGTTELELTVRSQAVSCSPDNPAYFDDFYFYGGEEDMEVTVLAGCSIQPVFYPHPPLIGTLTGGDIADLPYTGEELLAALQRLFDLCVLTDPMYKVAYIEPRCNFYNREVVDLTERIDTSVPIVVEELGDDTSRTLRLAYRLGDEAVEEWKGQTGERFGEWSAPIYNLFAKDGARSLENNLFVASLSERGGVALAPSASLISTKSNSKRGHETVQNLNFPTKIISFRGMCDLPDGELWDYPRSGDKRYPLLTFFDDGSLGGAPHSLLFEDRDGVEGLHKWWDDRVDTLNHSRRLSVRVRLLAAEVEWIVNPSGIGFDFRSLYMLRVDGERVLCRLERICDYNPNEPSVRMLFVTV